MVQNFLIRLNFQEEIETPIAKITEAEKRVNAGDSFELRCIVSGSPQPSVLWLFNNNAIEKSENIELRADRLIISNIKTEMAGLYTCRATSPSGLSSEDTSQVSVERVIEKPRELLIDVNPRQASHFVGESVQFSCVVSNINQASIRLKWSKHGEQLSERQFHENGLLTLRNLQEQDSGAYICDAEDIESGVRSRAVANLIVSRLVEPEIPLKVEVQPKEAILIEGKSAEFICKVEGGKNPVVTWKKLGDNLSERYQINQNILTIQNVQINDRGYFECVAESDQNSARDYVKVEVEERELPKADIYPRENPIVNQGDTTYLQCRIEAGKPSPVIEWRRLDGRPLSEKVSLSQENTFLKISNIGQEEFGVYECVASNAEGLFVARKSIIENIRVESKPEEESIQTITDGVTATETTEVDRVDPDVYLQQDVLEVEEGRDARLVCRTSYNGAVKFLWKKIENGDEIVIPNENGVAVINNVDQTDAAIYVCVVSNKYGYSSDQLSLIVRNRPATPEPIRVNVNPKERVVPIGGHAEFSCIIQSNSDALVRWSKSDGRLSADHTIHGNILRIHNIRLEDAGRYICTAQVGLSINFDAATLDVSQPDPNSAFPVFIRVEEKPTFNIQTPSGGFKFGHKITAQCIGNNPDIVDVAWSKVEGVIRSVVQFDKQQNSNTMTIPALMPMDLGNYICISTTSEGTKGQNVISFERSAEQPNQFKYIINGPKELTDPQQTVESHSSHSDSTSDSFVEIQKPDENTAPDVRIIGERQIEVFEGKKILNFSAELHLNSVTNLIRPI
jgi:hypothetical protein